MCGRDLHHSILHPEDPVNKNASGLTLCYPEILQKKDRGAVWRATQVWGGKQPVAAAGWCYLSGVQQKCYSKGTVGLKKQNKTVFFLFFSPHHIWLGL